MSSDNSRRQAIRNTLFGANRIFQAGSRIRARNAAPAAGGLPKAGRGLVRAFALALALLGPGASALAAQGQPEKTEINIGVGPGWGAGGHAIIAYYKGYFQEEGFRAVHLKSFPAGMMQLEAMVSGAVDVSNPTQAPVLTLRSNGLPVVVLANLSIVDQTMGMVLRKSAGVRIPPQLEGLKIGLLKGSGAEQMLQLICTSYHIDCTRIQVVNLPPPAQLAALAAGSIDGMVTWQPWVHQALENGDTVLVHTGTTSYLGAKRGHAQRVDYTRTVLASTQSFVKSNPKTVDAILRAYIKAQAFVADSRNYDEVVAIYSKYFHEDPKLNQILLKQNVNSLALDDGYLHDMKAVADFLGQTGRLRNPVDIKALTDAAPLAGVAPALVGKDVE